MSFASVRRHVLRAENPAVALLSFVVVVAVCRVGVRGRCNGMSHLK